MWPDEMICFRQQRKTRGRKELASDRERNLASAVEEGEGVSVSALLQAAKRFRLALS